MGLHMPWLAVAKAGPGAADAAEIKRLLNQIGVARTAIGRAFLKAVQDLADRVDVAEIARLLRSGNVEAAVEAVSAAQITAGMAPVADQVVQQTVLAARAAAPLIPTPGRADFVFSATNPKTVEFLREREMLLIRELSNESRATIRQVITQGVARGENPMATAIDVREHIGLTRKQSMAVQNYRRTLTEDPRAALQRVLRDRRFDEKVLAAIADDKPLAASTVDKLVAQYEFRYRRYRSETIARTEAIRAVNAGNMETWRQAAADGTVQAHAILRRWIFTRDPKVREAHELIPSMNPGGVGLDEPFQSIDGPIMYPGDPLAPPEATINCRCTVMIRMRAALAPGER